MNGPQIKEEFAENVCSKPLEEINKEVKEEHIAEEMVINMEEHDAIKVFVSSSSVRKENVDLMSEVFKVLLSLEARCGVEVDSAKKEAEHLRERIKAKEIDLQNVNNSIQSISETARKLQSQSNASQIEPSKQDSVLGSTEPADIKMRTFPSRELREKVKFLKETFQKLKLKIEQPQKEKFQNEKILILSAKLQEIENSLQSVSGPWQEKKLMNAIIRTLRKVKKLQSQSNASQSEPMKQDSGLASAEPADKKMRKLQDQKPTKSFAPPQQLEEKGELVAQPLPNIMLSSNLDTTRIKLPSNEKIAQSVANIKDLEEMQKRCQKLSKGKKRRMKKQQMKREEILKVKEVSAEEEQRRDAQRQKLGNINNAKLLTGSHFPPPPPCFKDLSYDAINSYKPMPLLPNLQYPFPTYRLFPLPNGFINGKSLPEAQFGQNFQWRKWVML